MTDSASRWSPPPRKWRFQSRDGGFEMVSPLWLYPELECSQWWKRSRFAYWRVSNSLASAQPAPAGRAIPGGDWLARECPRSRAFAMALQMASTAQ
jgi:hypothetical protein